MTGLAKELELAMRTTVEGHFHLAVRRPDGSVRTEASFKNTMLDRGIDHIMGAEVDSTTGVLHCAHVGASSEPVTPEQTGLVARIAAATGSGNISLAFLGEAHSYALRLTRKIRFNLGAAAGVIAEVGMGWGTAANQVASRALVKDALGNPSTITVLSDEYLDITYTLTIYPDIEDKPFTLNLSSGSHSGVLRPMFDPWWYQNHNFTYGFGKHARTQAFTGPIGAITEAPAGPIGAVRDSQGSAGPYVRGTFYRDIRHELQLTDGNTSGGIGALLVIPEGTFTWPTWLAYQMSFEPKIPKTSEHVFHVVVRHFVGRR